MEVFIRCSKCHWKHVIFSGSKRAWDLQRSVDRLKALRHLGRISAQALQDRKTELARELAK